MWAPLLERIEADASILANVNKTGFHVLDDVFDEGSHAQFKREIQALHEKKLMQQNQVQFTTASGEIVLTKPGVFEADLHEERLREQCPTIAKLFNDMDDLQRALTDHDTPVVTGGSASSFTLKLQYNDGSGGCFPWHYDNPAKPNKRRITCLLYLNDGWSDGDGGELMLLPFLGQPATIAPLGNRIVLFQSDFVLHRVLPTTQPRFCFTVWLDGDRTNTDEETFLRGKHLTPEHIATLQETPLQRSVSRVVYSDRYEESIVECFGEGTKGCKYAIALHRAFVRQTLSNPALADFVQLLKDKRPY